MGYGPSDDVCARLDEQEVRIAHREVEDCTVIGAVRQCSVDMRGVHVAWRPGVG